MPATTENPLLPLKDDIDVIRQTSQENFAGLTKEQLNWQPGEKKWSIGQCLAHLIKINRAYCDAIRNKLDTSANAATNGQAPFQHSLMGRLFIKLMDPRSSLKMPAPPAMRPDVQTFEPSVVQEFIDQQAEIAELLTKAGEYDFTRVKIPSPFFGLLKFRLGEIFDVVVKHEQRHVQQAKRVMQAEGFPASPL